jgi:1-acyl-sn-glycerol-3-phosphate acyltransferase
MWYAPLLVWWARVSVGVRHRVRGLENLPSRNCVVISNHQSAWETMFLSSLLQPNASVLKRELLDMPLFGPALAMVDPIAIERQKPALALKQLLEQGRARLADGRWVIVYPEGTRVRPGAHADFNPGGVVLAIKAGVDIVPVAHNAGTVWHSNWMKLCPGEITVVIGPPITVANRSREDVQQEVERWIRTTMAALPKTSDCGSLAASAAGQ